MDRRSLLALVPALGAAACTASWPTNGPSAETVANDVALIASSLQASVVVLSSAQPPLPPAVIQGVLNGLGIIQTAAQDYAKSNTTGGQQTAVQQIQSGLAAIQQSFLTSNVPIPPKFTPYLLAAAALLPAIQIFVGLTPQSSAPQARAVLRRPL